MLPVVALFFFRTLVRAEQPAAGVRSDSGWLGVLLLGAGLLLATMGNLVQIDDVVFVALLVWLVGILMLGYGLKRCRVYIFPFAVMFLMLPIPWGIIGPIRGVLDSVSVTLSLWLFQLADVPAALNGLVLEVGGSQFWVHQRLRAEPITSTLDNLLPVYLVVIVGIMFLRPPRSAQAAVLVLDERDQPERKKNWQGKQNQSDSEKYAVQVYGRMVGTPFGGSARAIATSENGAQSLDVGAVLHEPTFPQT